MWGVDEIKSYLKDNLKPSRYGHTLGVVKIVFNEFQKLVNLEQHYKTDIITAVLKRFPNWKI